MQSHADIEHDIKGFIIETFLLGDSSKMNPDGSLLGNVIDSAGALNLVAFLQEHFGIEVQDDEVLPSNLDTINNLVAFVSRKLGAKRQVSI